MIIGSDGERPPWLIESPGELIRRAARLGYSCREMLNVVRSAKASAESAYAAELEQAVSRELQQLPVERLRQASEGAVRLSGLKSGGFRTVADIRSAGPGRLESIRGVGAVTATRVADAAQRVEEAVRVATRVRFDADSRPQTQTALLSSLRSLHAERHRIRHLVSLLEEAVRKVDADLELARLEARPIRRFFAGHQRRAAAGAAYERLTALLAHAETQYLLSEIDRWKRQRRKRRLHRTDELWADYTARPDVYNRLLSEVAGRKPKTTGPPPSLPRERTKPAPTVPAPPKRPATRGFVPRVAKPAKVAKPAPAVPAPALGSALQGFLPRQIVKRIEAFRLDTSLLTASLRGYQTFGAKFALVQQRTILGDEMGLGKTIEALAMLCHLRSKGARRLLVVCPASVLVNWQHEIRRHSRLAPTWRLHGPHKVPHLRQWTQVGGVAVTTFDTLRNLQPPAVGIAAMVVDEAHYVKNPSALRTRAVRTWLGEVGYALLMSGTPMENRVEEFHTLVSHIRPDVAATVRAARGAAGPAGFRRMVAPVYLRRNREDVLDELPPKVEIASWSTLDGPAAEAYRRAVAGRNFMAMRRAAFLTPNPMDSPKLRRLVEIVEEAASNNRKVVVFSFFRDVIRRARAAVGSLAVGSITGDVPAALRQDLVDRFTATPGPAVLVNQIQAGGVGLNIQAASVVILTEPQWKPSTEEQAIARCHRMGQRRSIEVHRLLSEGSVDERMLEILARKSALFAEYVRNSTMRDASPEATDPTVNTTRRTVSQLELERRIIEFERRRLGIGA